MAQQSLPSFSSLWENINRNFSTPSFVTQPNNMTTPNRTAADSRTPKPVQAPTAAARSCVICTEEIAPGIRLIQACRSCKTDYCTECLVDIFLAASVDNTRMPPRCCNLIQIHTVLGLPSFAPELAKKYREKFEEWITPAKTYCPSPTCSAFIPERYLPSTVTPQEPPTLKSVLNEILKELTMSSPARFFRTSIETANLPGYTNVISKPMDLNIIGKRLLSAEYKTASDFTEDMKLIVNNAREYNGPTHPVTKVAEQLFARYLQELANGMDRLIKSGKTQSQGPEKIFACTKCHIAICVSCKQIDHTGCPCDTSAQDHEIAMLETFGYKRCPRCKAGVKKMFGCSHMQCVCGAHWCYYCQRSIDMCDGGCDERANAEISDEEDYDSELDSEEGSEDGEGGEVDWPALHAARRQTLMTVPNTARVAQRSSSNPETIRPPQPPPAAPRTANTPINLDAGGARRWEVENLDFGEEPDDEFSVQVWSCNHNFKLYEAPPDDGINRGDLDKMECNRCFMNVELKHPHHTFAKPSSSAPKKRKRLESQAQAAARLGSKNNPIAVSESPQPENFAHECVRCKLVVCRECKTKYAGAKE